jgi:hypothetical protein
VTWFRRAQVLPADENDGMDVDLPTFMRRSGEWSSGVRRVSAKPLEWSAKPPDRAGWWYVRRPGTVDYEPIKVLPGFDYPRGFEYSGPLPTPYEPRGKR